MALRRAEILTVAAIVAAAGIILYVGLILGPELYPPGSTCGCPAELLGPAIGTPTPTTDAWAHWYNASVASAGGGATLGETHWQFQTPTGSIVSPGTNWSLTVEDASRSVVGVYNLTAGVWSLGSHTPWTSLMQVSIYSANVSLDGDHVIIAESGDGSGQTSVSIP
ncbi:MAG: hypothetical protein L3J87_02990 [Thermoplasmata archaeon]|nr:hypothetical protein [Thermoplasmata archaeon]MCI4344574.1 hypothetical protein [Thermoplasmata archaeon]